MESGIPFSRKTSYVVHLKKQNRQAHGFLSSVKTPQIVYCRTHILHQIRWQVFVLLWPSTTLPSQGLPMSAAALDPEPYFLIYIN